MKQIGDKFSRINYTFRESDKQEMTIKEIALYTEALKETINNNDYEHHLGFELYREFERWQNVHLTIKEKYFKRYGYLNENEVIDKYSINKINSEFE